MRRSSFPAFVVATAALSTALLVTSCRDAAEDRAIVSFADDLLLASAKVALPPPGIAPADLPDPDSHGAQLVTKYCTRCHALPAPAMHSVTDWPRTLRRMWLRADRVASSFGVPVPTTAERVTLVRYMTDNALVVSRATLPKGPGRDVFASTCSQCHELPDPTQHSAADWPSVVMRMGQHREAMLGQSLLREDFEKIVLYLEQVSGGA